MEFHDKILSLLVDLAAGQLSLCAEDIEMEPIEHRDLLYGVLCLKEEIDYQHKQIHTLSESRQQILDVISDIILIIRADGKINVVNNLLYEHLKYSTDDFRNMHISDLLFLANGNTPLPYLNFQREHWDSEHLTLEINQTLWKDRRFLIRARDESFSHVLVNLYNINMSETESSNEAHFLCTITDASDSTLLQELQEKQYQLVQTSKLASLGELSSGIAHELNNPLFAVTGFNEILGRRLQKKHPDAYLEVKDIIGKIDIAAERMKNIISHVQTFARQDSLVFEPADLHQIIHNSCMLMKQQLKRHDISLEINISIEDPIIYCCAHRLEQVFINLLANARDAILDSKTDTRRRITIATQDSSTHSVQIIISDTGTGIPNELIKRIFDPFFSTKEVGKGMGLGLSISYGILQEHNASINVHSTSNDGTSFIISLPRLPNISSNGK